MKKLILIIFILSSLQAIAFENTPEGRRDHIYKELIDSKISKLDTLAILANIAYETGDTYDPKTKQKGVGKVKDWWKKSTGGRGTGLLQWDDRRLNLKAYAEKHNESWDDLDIQIDFLLYELDTTEKRGFSFVKKVKTLKDKVIQFCDKIERPGKHNHKKRLKRANELIKLYE